MSRMLSYSIVFGSYTSNIVSVSCQYYGIDWKAVVFLYTIAPVILPLVVWRIYRYKPFLLQEKSNALLQGIKLLN